MLLETEYTDADVMPANWRWRRTELLEWALRQTMATYSLAHSAVLPVHKLDELPGGPFVPKLLPEGSTGHPELFGHPQLLENIAALYGAKAEQVLLGRGAAEVDYLLVGAILQQGGVAIVETPTYQPILRAAECFADKVIRLPRRRETDCLPDPEELKQLIDERTRLICLTNLHNPTGVLLPNDLLAEIVSLANEVGAQVLVDEVFRPMENWDYRKHGHSVGAISVGSMDKTYGLSSLRCGCAVGPEDVIRTSFEFNNLQGVEQPYMTQDLAAQILGSADAMKSFKERTDTAQEGRAVLEEFLKEFPDCEYILPTAGINAILLLPPGSDDMKFIAALKEKQDTIAFPGSLFGLPGTIRVSFGGEPDKIREGFNRLGAQLREW